MKYVMVIDLGTSAVKAVLMDQAGHVVFEASESYPLYQPKPGYSEQHSEDWVEQTIVCIRRLMDQPGVNAEDVDGISFSGQMHGLKGKSISSIMASKLLIILWVLRLQRGTVYNGLRRRSPRMFQKESIDIIRTSGKEVHEIVSIGGGARNEAWLQMQADIFGADIIKLENEQGPAMGAAMLAAYGCGWFSSLQQCAATFICRAKTYSPYKERTVAYNQLFEIYKQVYSQTRTLNEQLVQFR